MIFLALCFTLLCTLATAVPKQTVKTSCSTTKTSTSISTCTSSISTSAKAALPWTTSEFQAQSAPTCASTSFTPRYSSFSYTQESSNRYATPISAPVTFASAFAPAYSQAKSLLPANVTYTSYSLNSKATTSQDGMYGQSAYAALWTGYTYNRTVPFTTTVFPTPVAASELVYPPALYSACSNADACIGCYKFDKDFIWGVAGSAWQIEGALQQEGRGPGNLDGLGNQGPGGMPTGNDSVEADMNYYLYKQDIARLAAIGVPYYSFSISWSRIVPFGVKDSPINTQGLDHYDDLIKTCLHYGIKPIVTLVHVDAPTSISLDKDFTEDYLYYAKQVMARYAEHVPYWVTFNEPNIGMPYSFQTYNGLTNILMAHSAVYKWYKQTLGGTGKVTIKFANNLAVPRDLNKASDLTAASRYQDFILGIMANPLFLGKQYPSKVLATPNLNLTALTAQQLSYINGTVDFWAFDPYVSQFASEPANGFTSCINNSSDPLWPRCAELTEIQQNGWQVGQKSNDYAYIAPQYVRQQLGYVWNTFRPSGILISEFGFNPFMESEKKPVEQLYDLERSLYYESFLKETLKSMHLDGVNVIGALAWSFVDNNEFGSFENQYGLQTVNRTSGLFERHYKRSFFDLVDFFHKYVAA
ncbi:beta-glucosidase [Aureobasidium subglaciale]|nr:beta-glucosidase [Aureobasidium subglaciale]KAI5222114.1 beta-glucosidase [Aureobasidium subglaciale]KAI5225927.1 beta-glucosidase [Aureobasidium subglaciale]KAI5261881.1 beta-glucosidase [Aureobasidium subglaciale]